MCERSYLSGYALIVYRRDNYYGIFSEVEYVRLTTKRGNGDITRKLEEILAERRQKEENNRVHKETKGRIVSLTAAKLRHYFAYHKEPVIVFLPFAPNCPIQEKSFLILTTFQSKSP